MRLTACPCTGSRRSVPPQGEPARPSTPGGQAGKTREDLTSVPGVRGDRKERGRDGGGDQAVRQQIAFYASTPAYRPVLEQHGWGDLQPQLNTLSKQGEWVKMGELISDEVLDAFAVVAPINQVATQVKARFGDCVDRFSFYAPYKMSPEEWSQRARRVPLLADRYL